MASLACCNGAAVLSANVKLGSLKPSSPALTSSSSSLACFKRSPFSRSSSAASPRLPCKPLHARAEEGIVDNVQDAADKASAQVKNLGQQAQDFLTGASKDVQKGAADATKGVKRESDRSDVGGDVESLSDKISGSVQDAGEALQANVDKAKDAASDAASSVKGSVGSLGRDAQKSADDAKSRIQQ